MSLAATSTWDNTFAHMWATRIIPDYLDRILIAGRSRTGKSTLIQKITNSIRLTLHESMPIEDLIGGFQLIDGRTVWVDGPAVKALKQGKALQLDEINYQPVECISMLYCLMDKPAAITLPTGERVVAAPGYCVIATHNPPPSVLPHPIYDRIDVFLKVETL